MSITETDHSPTTVQRSAERRRHRRRIAAVVTPAALAALVLGLGAAGQLGNSASPAWGLFKVMGWSRPTGSGCG